MSGNINDPKDLGDYGDQLDAMVLARATEERKQEDENERLRRIIAKRAKDDTLTFSFTDGGNGDRFASRRVGQILLYDEKQRPEYYIVDEFSKRWVRDGKGSSKRTRWAREIVDELRDAGKLVALAAENEPDPATRRQLEQQAKSIMGWAKQSDTTARYHLMARIACEAHGMLVDPVTDFDVRRDVLACQDTLIELQSDGIHPRPITPEDMISMTTSVRYNPGILRTPPREVVEYLNMFIPDPATERLIFKIFGSALLGGNIHRLFVLILGASTTGKSQLMEAVEAALGDYAGTGKPSVFRGNNDDRGRPDILALLKRRIAVFNEASKEWDLHGDRVKDITGGGNVAVRALHSNTIVEEQPHFTPFILANNLPTINGVDGGTKRRMMVISFNHELPAGVPEDSNIKQAFVASEAVREWMLARLVQGYIDARREGIADCRAAFDLDTSRAFEKLSPVHGFITWMKENEKIDFMSEEQMIGHGWKSKCVLKGVLYSYYADYIKHYGDRRDRDRVLSLTDFNDELERNFGWTEATSGGRRWAGVVLRDVVVNGAATQHLQVVHGGSN